MTTIRFKHTIGRFTLSIDGHAGYGPGGKDVVCASISTMAGLLLMACEKSRDKKEINIKQCEETSGHVCVDFRYRKASGSIRDIAELIIEGLSELALQYPTNVKVEALP